MPFEIIRNDITHMQVDAIVNTANPRPVIGSGVDAAVHAKAGPLLLAARKVIGVMNTGEARVTPGFRLPCRHVIHTVGPVWEDGGHGEAWLLRQCYDNSLKAALRHRCKTVAFPLISSGNYGFPKKIALQVAVDSIREFLKDHEMHVYLVVFSKKSLELSGGLADQIHSFIDDAYVQEREKAEYSFTVSRNFDFVRERLGEPEAAEEHPCASECEELSADWDLSAADPSYNLEFNWNAVERDQGEVDSSPTILDLDVRRRETGEQEKTVSTGASPRTEPQQLHERDIRPDCAPAPVLRVPILTKASEPKRRNDTVIPLFDEKELQTMVQQADAGFSETLLKLIDKSGEKDSDIYKRANVDRKLFSKIRNNPQYKPSKPTAVAFAIALELDLEETRDFIGRAGYALSRSNKFDIIIEYFITHGRYDIYEINLMLFEFDQSLLGA